MYCEYYGLVRSPFEMTPDPSFLFLGEAHREGLATLVYGVKAGKGFVMLTGEVGTGKTTLLHALLGQLDSQTKSAFIFNPRLTPLGFFRVLFEELDIKPRRKNKADYLIQLNEFLIERLGKNEKTLLIVDEAQNLSIDMLEEIRLLSNLETPRSKLIQIMLVGQPELKEMLRKPELRQLRQRVVTPPGHIAVRQTPDGGGLWAVERIDDPLAGFSAGQEPISIICHVHRFPRLRPVIPDHNCSRVRLQMLRFRVPAQPDFQARRFQSLVKRWIKIHERRLAAREEGIP